MSNEVATLRIKATDPEQGEFVIINEADFDPEQHERFDAVPEKALGIAGLRAELTARGIEFDVDAKKADLKALLESADAQQ
jgi:hypothetical protein